MKAKSIPEINCLLARVEEMSGQSSPSSKGFESLESSIEEKLGEHVSSSTLKRLWGYVSSDPEPRRTTLDILSRYVGCTDFNDYRRLLKEESGVVSEFLCNGCISSSDLSEGEQIAITWAPDRVVKLKYLGGGEFEVMDPGRSKLFRGDRFEASEFMHGFPLNISRILRDGAYTDSYVAGLKGGLTGVEKC